MNQVDKELMQEKGILTENEKADEYEIQKAAMKEAAFFLAAMLEKNSGYVRTSDNFLISEGIIHETALYAHSPVCSAALQKQQTA